MVTQTASVGPPPPPAPDSCNVSFSPIDNSFAAPGDAGSFLVTPALAECNWSVSSPNEWISVADPEGTAKRDDSAVVCVVCSDSCQFLGKFLRAGSGAATLSYSGSAVLWLATE